MPKYFSVEDVDDLIDAFAEVDGKAVTIEPILVDDRIVSVTVGPLRIYADRGELKVSQLRTDES